MTNVADMRRSYERGELCESDIGNDPFVVFRSWFAQAIDTGELEANAMTLSTVSNVGKPRSRVVLLKELRDDGGFVFFTNYESAKAAEIGSAGCAALNFLWLKSERQVRVEGRVEKIDSAASDLYFASRPRESQLGAWASLQSTEIADARALHARYAEVESRFAGQPVPRPSHWGGYVVIPDLIEFWQGRPGRMHDRIEYAFVNGQWSFKRRMP